MSMPTAKGDNGLCFIRPEEDVPVAIARPVDPNEHIPIQFSARDNDGVQEHQPTADEEIAIASSVKVKKVFQPHPIRKCSKLKVLALVLVLVTVAAVVAIILVPEPEPDDNDPITTPATPLTIDPRSERHTEVARIVGQEDISTEDSLSDPSSPQYMAAQWLADNDTATIPLDDHRQVIQRYTAAVLYYSTAGQEWKSQLNFMSPQHECKWNGKRTDNNGTCDVPCSTAFLGTPLFGACESLYATKQAMD